MESFGLNSTSWQQYLVVLYLTPFFKIFELVLEVVNITGDSFLSCIIYALVNMLLVFLSLLSSGNISESMFKPYSGRAFHDDIQTFLESKDIIFLLMA